MLFIIHSSYTIFNMSYKHILPECHSIDFPSNHQWDLINLVYPGALSLRTGHVPDHAQTSKVYQSIFDVSPHTL